MKNVLQSDGFGQFVRSGSLAVLFLSFAGVAFGEMRSHSDNSASPTVVEAPKKRPDVDKDGVIELLPHRLSHLLVADDRTNTWKVKAFERLAEEYPELKAATGGEKITADAFSKFSVFNKLFRPLIKGIYIRQGTFSYDYGHNGEKQSKDFKDLEVLLWMKDGSHAVFTTDNMSQDVIDQIHKGAEFVQERGGSRYRYRSGDHVARLKSYDRLFQVLGDYQLGGGATIDSGYMTNGDQRYWHSFSMGLKPPTADTK